jgi:hypothetical protein
MFFHMDITHHLQAGVLTFSKVKGRWMIFLCAAAAGLSGCTDYYAGPPAYGPGGYYASRPVYAGPGYGPGYGYGGSVVVDVNDRPYYTRGPGYYSGHTYYVWRPGHWAVRHGRKVWIHGHYVLRG